MQKKELIDTIKMKIANGEINSAIELLLKYFDKGKEINEIIMQSGRYCDLLQRDADGTISHENFQNDLNRLRVNILRFVDNIKSQDLNRRENLTIRAIKDDYKRSIARIKVIDALKDNDTGLTIKEIHDKSGLKQRKYLIFSLNELKEVGIIERIRFKNRSLNKLSQEGKKFIESIR